MKLALHLVLQDSQVRATREQRTIRTPTPLLDEVFAKYQVSHRSFHVLVPQAVDDGVEHGGHHPIEEGDELV